MPDPIASPPGKAPHKPGQAVVIVHGMGEQRPMDTLRGFVQAVWSHDPSRAPFYAHVADPADPAGAKINQSWITPDSRTNSYELRRITTPYDVDGRRTDFYELYWADVTQGTTRGRLAAWVTNLLWRSPPTYRPTPESSIWSLFWPSSSSCARCSRSRPRFGSSKFRGPSARSSPSWPHSSSGQWTVLAFPISAMSRPCAR